MNSTFASLLFILFLSTMPCYSLAKPECQEIERNALLHFKNNLKFPPSTNSILSSWVGDDCCSWKYGVHCSSITGNVIELYLSYFQISYNHALDGNVLFPLLSLNYLTHLDLSNNFFMGNQIPKFIGSFKSLQYLDLTSSYFSGRIPYELGNLSSLQQLHLGNNLGLFTENIAWISRLKFLRVLDLSYVNMSIVCNSWLLTLNTLPYLVELTLSFCELNSIDQPLAQVNFTGLSIFNIGSNAIHSRLPDWLWKLNNLKYLDVSNNSFFGSLPASIANLSLLEHFDIYANNLTGTIPESIGQLQSLIELHIDGNAFTGTVSEVYFSNMSKLDYVDMSYNLLVFKISDNWVPPFKLTNLCLEHCQVGPQFPNWLKTQHSLVYLDLNNAGIEGSVPNWFENFSNLSYLDLSNNQISGKLSTFSNSMSILKLMLSNNSFTGPIPSEFREGMISIRIIDLSTNDLNGSIPSFLCEFENLYYLSLSNNKLSGKLPDCWKNISDLGTIKFSYNSLHGKIPKSICNLSILKSLQLNHNNLSGSIPSCLMNSTSLTVLDLSHNNFSGSIPQWNENSQLSIISYRHNCLTGIIPDLSHLKCLKILDLSNNNILGPIPLAVENSSPMPFLSGTPTNSCIIYTPYYGELLAIIKGIELEFTPTNQIYWKLIDLSENNLNGHIPDDLMKFHALAMLNLSGNNLTGQIPTNIDELNQLQVLDLSRNKLSGVIPLSLKSLTFLEVINLSYNNLSGEIPFGDQLQTLDNISSYEGNPYLCGYLLRRSCDQYQDNQTSTRFQHGNREELLWFYMAIAPGFVVGFWLVCGIIILHRECRIAYFNATDKLYYLFFKRM